MKKTLSILKKGMTFASLPPLIVGVALPTVLATVKLFQQPINARRAVPDKWLKVDSGTKTLYGFQDWVTANQLRKEGFNTLAIPKDVVRIAPYAFSYMLDGKANDITTVELNANLQSIGKGAFTYCYGIEKLLNFDTSEKLTTVEQDAFSHCKRLGGNENGILIIPECLKSIGHSAFKSCEKIIQVTLPNTLEELGDYAFNNCYGIATIMINNDGSIPQWAGRRSFAFRQSLGTQVPTVILPNLNVSLDEWKNIFVNNLGTVDGIEFIAIVGETDDTYFDYEDDQKTTIVGIHGKFEEATKVSIIKIPDTVTKIKAGAFKNVFTASRGKWRLELNSNLQTIEQDAFSGCTGICDQLTIPDSVTSIGSSAFYNTNIYGTLTLPKNDTYVKIEASTFAKTKINKIVLPPQMQHVDGQEELVFGADCFDDCIYLDTIDISSFNPLISIFWKGDDKITAFSNVPHKGMVIYPYESDVMNPIKNMGPKLKVIKLCNQDEDVNQCWMPYEPSIKKPTPFPYDVLGEKAYYMNGDELVGLRDEYKEKMEDYNLIKIPSVAKTIKWTAFLNVFHDTEVTQDYEKPTKRWQLSFDYGVEKICGFAFQNCELIVGDVVFPRSLKAIDEHAFVEANGITSFTVPNTVTWIGKYAFEQRHTTTPDWDGGTRLRYIDLTDFSKEDVESLVWEKEALKVNGQGGTIYVKLGTQTTWESKNFDLSSGWKFVEVA